MILSLNHVSKNFGGLAALSEVSFDVGQGEIVGVIGPNGAGKTTLFNLITGVFSPTSGQILFRDKPIVGLRPHKVTELGISRTFQNIRLFSNESVLQNVMIACQVRQKLPWWHAPLFLPGYFREEREIREKSRLLLDAVNLGQHADEQSTSLPYGAQRRLEIARALATEPRFLLLDEPAAGMNPQESIELMDFIRTIRQRFNLTILLIEHDMKVVMGSVSTSGFWITECVSPRDPPRKSAPTPRSSRPIWVRST